MSPEPCCNPLCGNDAAPDGDLCAGCRTNWDALAAAEDQAEADEAERTKR